MTVVAGNRFERGIDRFVRWVILPVTGIVPVLVRTGLLFAGFAALWAGFFAALVLDPATLDRAWQAVAGLPLAVQAIVWLLFLPLTAGLWVWQTDWPLVVRLVLIAGIAGWNLLTFLPRRGATASATPTGAVAPATPDASEQGRSSVD
jgi:hypothetical protein